MNPKNMISRRTLLHGLGAKKHRTLSNLYLTLLEAADRPRDKFGVSDTGLRGVDQSGLIRELLV